MDVHFIGEIKGATGFHFPNLTCRFKVIGCDDTHWRLEAGDMEGFTQIAGQTSLSKVVWNHPLDMHFFADSVETWPSLYLEVWGQDEYGRNTLAAYGQCLLPPTPGDGICLECATWRPEGSLMERIKSLFLGSHPQLQTPEEASLATSRFPLRTESMGTVSLELSVVMSDPLAGGVILPSNHQDPH
uniref:B9 domain-containing protein 2 n=1 Tax=Rhizochromulina marina TaxID=1034831 RepID=A0A7S2SV27_9STRA|mmetsp:Transcript_8960/g.25613  ORF Transcript_8960/g.25613 Transcript_8960/m.25613 type:complete len:186 (+) Transcript_8960:79-636(+)